MLGVSYMSVGRHTSGVDLAERLLVWAANRVVGGADVCTAGHIRQWKILNNDARCTPTWRFSALGGLEWPVVPPRRGNNRWIHSRRGVYPAPGRVAPLQPMERLLRRTAEGQGSDRDGECDAQAMVNWCLMASEFDCQWIVNWWFNYFSCMLSEAGETTWKPRRNQGAYHGTD